MSQDILPPTLPGLFAFFALLRVAIRDDIPGTAPEIIVVFDGEHGAVSRQQVHEGYKASRPVDDQARLPLTFLANVKRGLEHRPRRPPRGGDRHRPP